MTQFFQNKFHNRNNLKRFRNIYPRDEHHPIPIFHLTPTLLNCSWYSLTLPSIFPSIFPSTAPSTLTTNPTRHHFPFRPKYQRHNHHCTIISASNSNGLRIISAILPLATQTIWNRQSRCTSTLMKLSSVSSIACSGAINSIRSIVMASLSASGYLLSFIIGAILGLWNTNTLSSAMYRSSMKTSVLVKELMSKSTVKSFSNVLGPDSTARRNMYAVGVTAFGVQCRCSNIHI